MSKAELEAVFKETPEALRETFLKIWQFSKMGCNGNVTVHFAGGLPRKIDYNSSEQLENSK